MAQRSNIFIVGPMGAGKTTVGKRLAQLRNMDFEDSDHVIEERTGVDISFIFEKEGEAGFRKRERTVINELTQANNIVLATGGGAVIDPENRKDLRGRGFVVYLYATVDQQVARTRHNTNRPLLDTDDPRSRLEELMEVRDPLYREIADLVLPTADRQAKALAKTIDQKLDEAFNG